MGLNLNSVQSLANAIDVPEVPNLGILNEKHSDVELGQALVADKKKYENQICADWALIAQLEQEKNGTLLGGFKKDIIAAIEELREAKEEMEKEIEDFATGTLFNTDKYMGKPLTEEEMFEMLFDPFMQALQPILDFLPNLGLPELPIIGNLTTIIKKITDMGRIIRNMDQKTVDMARAQAKEVSDAEKELNELKKEDRQANMTPWQKRKDDFRHSKMGEILAEIVDLFWEVLEIIRMIVSNLLLYCIIEIINIFKPVIEAFQLMVGEIMTILQNALTLTKIMLLSSEQLVKYFWRMLEKKLGDLYNLLYFAASVGWNGSIPENYLISATYQDIVSCELQISSIMYSLNDVDLNYALSANSKQIKSLSSKAKKFREKLAQINNGKASSQTFADIGKTSKKVEEKIERLENRNAQIIEFIDKNKQLSIDFETSGVKDEYTTTRLAEFLRGDVFLSVYQEKIQQIKDAPEEYRAEQRAISEAAAEEEALMEAYRSNGV